jgi:hypothetical protein
LKSELESFFRKKIETEIKYLTIKKWTLIVNTKNHYVASQIANLLYKPLL